MKLRSAAPCLVQVMVLGCTGAIAYAQDLEPRRWTHLPVGTNVVAVSYAYTKGDLLFDPVLRIEQADVEMHTVVVGYSRYFPLLGTTARIDALVPYQSGDWQGMVNGAPASVERVGFSDPVVRLSANLCGAPPLQGKEFAEYRQQHQSNTAVGVALEVRLPLGEYQEDKLINLGQNRFTIAPQLGVLHTYEQWSFELTGTSYFYSTNDEFFGGNELEQDPLFAVQGHVVRTFAGGFWLSAGAAYGWAGESTINGVDKDDDKRNLLYGGSVGFRVTDSQNIRIGYVRGDTRADVGSDTDTLFVGWSFRF